jgi:acyl transferase domain-containing protein/phosphopantetheinyl transferase
MFMSGHELEGHSTAAPIQGDVAIIGMAGVFPSAPDLDTFWHNIVNKVDAITDVPPERWDPEIFFDPDSYANDRVYSKRGGYLAYPVQFNPADIGVIPITAIHGEPEQFLALMVANKAMADAGYFDRPTHRHRTQIIMGRGNYLNRGILTMLQHVRGAEDALRIIRRIRPDFSEAELQAIKAEIKANLPLFNADTAATLIPNLTTGRIANRLDMMGANFTVDAACASSLVAAEIGVRDLLTGKCDLVLLGGIYVSTDVGFQSIFCQLHALSRRSKIRPFDKEADGLLLGEGAGCMVLKRLEEAVADGDRIYAVIKGVGTASDGRATGVLAPRVEGEELALRRAYAMAGVSPDTVQLIEAHGTATVAGDMAEVQAMARVFGPRDGTLPRCALGSIKSMIGHLMPAAGIAGLIKATLALYHKTLPPTLNYETPNPRLELEKTPFYINTETRPWIRGAADTPRRAGVNAFGFGGINGHVVLEEYRSAEETELPSHLLHWETEVCIFQGATRQALTEHMRQLQRYLESQPQIALKDLAYTLNTKLTQPYRVAIIASSLEDLGKKLEHALQRLSEPERQQIKERDGIYFFEEPLTQTGKLAFLFPGVGAAYVNMLADLCLHFPEVRSCFDLADQLFRPRKHPSRLPSQLIYPPPDPAEPERSTGQRRLWQEDGALEAIHAADGALFTLLKRLHIRPEMVVGHSFGDFFALLLAASPDAPKDVVIDAMTALEHSVHRTVHIYEQLRAAGQIPQDIALVNVGADVETVSNLIETVDGALHISMDNCPHQVVVVGDQAAVTQLMTLLKRNGIFYEALPLDQPAYHTSMFEVARKPLEAYEWSPPTHLVEVYSCTTASPYPKGMASVRQLNVEHWMRRVEFRKTVEAMYKAGARIFVEVGPGGILTAFVDDILRGRPYLAVAANVPRRSGITQLNHLVGMLASQRVPIDLDYLYRRRAPRLLSFDVVVNGSNNGSEPSGMVDLALLGTPTLRLSPTPGVAERKPAPSLGSADRLSPATASLSPHEKPESAPPSASTGMPGVRDVGQASTPFPHTAREGDQPLQVSNGAVAREEVAPPTVVKNAMQSYLQTMDQFLATQEEVMQAFMDRARTVTSATRQSMRLPSQPPEAVQEQLRPFIGKIISMVPSQEVVTQRKIDLAEDLLLHDHTFGGQISAVDTSLEPLPVIPMTMGMEIMAETAALLMPGKLLIGMKDIQTYQWIDLEEEHTTLQISARRRTADQDEIEVRVHNLGADAEGNAGKAVMALQGIMVFGEAYEEPPPVHSLRFASPKPPEFSAAEMYEERLMFHGPRFQGVLSLDTLGQEGIIGQLQALPTHNLFRSMAQPHLLIDLALLDAAGQLVGYWPLEWTETAYVMFPIRLDALHLFGPSVPPGHTVVCQVQMRDVHQKYMRADIDLIRPDGRLWMRLEGWCDWRFNCPDEAYDFSRFPAKTMTSTSMTAPIAPFPVPEDFDCCTVEYSDALYSIDAVSFWVKMWARLIFNRQERQEFYRLGVPEQTQIERLLARIAAKDAVRSLLQKRHGLVIHPADIAIAQGENGLLVPQGHWLQEIDYMPALSLAHTGQFAIAIAGRCAVHQRLGVGIQPIPSPTPEFEPAALTAPERSLLDSVEEATRLEWLMRFWSAKQAMANALGQDLTQGPPNIMVEAVDVDVGVLTVTLGERLVGAFPELAGKSITVYTTRHRDFVIASTLCERA